jgi:hypothetical protein
MCLAFFLWPPLWRPLIMAVPFLLAHLLSVAVRYNACADYTFHALVQHQVHHVLVVDSVGFVISCVSCACVHQLQMLSAGCGCFAPLVPCTCQVADDGVRFTHVVAVAILAVAAVSYAALSVPLPLFRTTAAAPWDECTV